MNSKLLVFLIGLGLVLVVGSNSLYIIKQTERGVLLKFGEVVNDDLEPGLGWKWPLVNQIRKFDARILTLDADPARFLTLEKKGVIVDSYAKWRIIDVGTFYRANNGEEASARSRLEKAINQGLRDEFGKRSLQEAVSGERDQLMTTLTAQLNDVVRNNYGVELIDIRVKRIDLPEQVSDSVFNRMISEREREAREHRSKGKEQAEVIRADADRQITILEAEAYRDAERIRGEGDALATAIYASAYNKDPEFYRFVRSLTAYKASFKGKEDVLLVDPKSDFFRYLNNTQGK